MIVASNTDNQPSLNRFVRVLHTALILGTAGALLSSEWVDDYKELSHPGFTIHMWFGLLVATAVLARVMYGLLGPAAVRFMEWVPYTRERWNEVMEDIRGLASLRLPERPLHGGLAGAVQSAGLLVLFFMSFSGTLMALYLEPGHKAGGLIKLVKEVHGAMGNLVYLYLALHVGAVVAHSLLGHPVWQRMFTRR